jgi:hypothetical protein
MAADHPSSFAKNKTALPRVQSSAPITRREMESSMNIFVKTALVSLGAVTVSSVAASAAVVCNDEGDCWRVKGRAEYKPELRLRVYDDDWKWKDGEKYRWRDAGPDHGYWRGGVWIGIR